MYQNFQCTNDMKFYTSMKIDDIKFQVLGSLTFN